MSKQELKNIGLVKLLVLVALCLMATPGWSQGSIDDLSDASTSATENLFLGPSAGTSLTSGNFNTGVGFFTLTFNKTGEWNTALGTGALYSNRNGDFNTAGGARSLFSNESGSDNTGFGYGSLFANVGGSRNTAVGSVALFNNTGGKSNTAVGAGALSFNLTGNLNTAIGALALESNTAGIENTAIGARALLANETGTFNTAISPRALQLNTTGEQNVAIGLRAGSFNETGSRNIFIGSQSGANSKYVDADNQLVIHGNASTSPLIEGDFQERTLRINGDFSATTVSEVSDARLKRDIQPIEGALGSILLLEGKSFSWRTDEYSERGFTEGPDLGLIAQEVEAVLPELVQEDRDGYRTIAYGKLMAVLVQCVKEQQAQLVALRDRIAQLEVRNGS